MASKSPSGNANGQTAAAVAPPSEEEIARRSYELYLARGGESSEAQAIADWLAAEAELRTRRRVSGTGVS